MHKGGLHGAGNRRTQIDFDHLAFRGLDIYSYAALTYFESQSLSLTSHMRISVEISWACTPSTVLSASRSALTGWIDA